MKNALFLVIGLVIIFGSIFLFFDPPARAGRYFVGEGRFMMLEINGVSIKAEIADTDGTRSKGLSGRESLGKGNGMLFVFDIPAQYGFWMSKMRFPIDILWMDENKRIVWIERGVTSGSFPQVFSPSSDALYVLELAANYSDELGAEIGTTVNFETQNVLNQ